MADAIYLVSVKKPGDTEAKTEQIAFVDRLAANEYIEFLRREWYPNPSIEIKSFRGALMTREDVKNCFPSGVSI